MRLIGAWGVWAVRTVWTLLPVAALAVVGYAVFMQYQAHGWFAAGVLAWSYSWAAGIVGAVYVLVTRLAGTVFGSLGRIERPPVARTRGE